MQVCPAWNFGCSALSLTGFGESVADGYSKTRYIHHGAEAKTFPEFVALCVKAVDFYHRYNNTQHEAVYRQAVISAYTISTQPLAETFLAQLGFKGVTAEVYHKYNHSATLWVMPVSDFLTAIGHPLAEKCRKSKEDTNG